MLAFRDGAHKYLMNWLIHCLILHNSSASPDQSSSGGGKDYSTRTLQTTGLVRQAVQGKDDDLCRTSQGWKGLVLRW